MVRLLSALLLLSTLSSCRRLSRDPDVTMTAHFRNDDEWTTTHVTTTANGNDVYIYGTNKTTNEQIRLGINDYEEGIATYAIDPFSVGTIDVNWADCKNGSHTMTATSGSINITGYTDGTISGSFDISNISEHITGTFIAVKPTIY